MAPPAFAEPLRQHRTPSSSRATGAMGHGWRLHRERHRRLPRTAPASWQPEQHDHNANTSVPCYLSGGYLFGDEPSQNSLNISGGLISGSRNQARWAPVVVNDSATALNGGSSSVSSLTLNDSTLNIRQASTSLAVVHGHPARKRKHHVRRAGVQPGLQCHHLQRHHRRLEYEQHMRVDNGAINIVNNNWSPATAQTTSSTTSGQFYLNLNAGVPRRCRWAESTAR